MSTAAGTLQLLAVLLTCLVMAAGCAGTSEITDFTSDGCSLFPDGAVGDRANWCDCCFAHDIAYWRGGSREERKIADKALRDCVLERTGDKALADLMYHGVRAGGDPALPTWYRWAYGWSYGRGYRALSRQEQQRAREKLDEYFKLHPAGYCGGGAGNNGSNEK